MTFFENILKKRLGDATSTKGVVPDDLWASIEQGLPPEEEIILPIRWSKIGWALLGLFLALASLYIVLREKAVEVPFALTTESQNEHPLTSAEKTNEQVFKKNYEKEGVSSNEIESLIKVSERKPQNLQDEMSASNLPDISASVLRDNTQEETKIPSTAYQAANTLLRSIEKPVNKEIAAANSEPELGLTDVGGISEAAEDDAKAISKMAGTTITESIIDSEVVALRKTTAVRRLDASLPITVPIRTNEEVIIENFKGITPVKKLRRSRAVLGVFVGTNMLRHKYPSTATDDLADVLNATRGEALGQSAALEFGYRLRPGLKVYTGVELLKTHTTFRYTQKWNTVMLRNGQQIDAIATRRVQHNNRQTLLSVPLMLEKTFAVGRWEAGLAAGVSFNYLTQQTGRSLNALQEVVTYSSGDGTNLPAPNFYLSYQLRPSISYRLNEQMSIQARAGLRWQRYGQSALYELSANSMLYGGSFGVVFGL